jgi:hypothetical protein
LKAVVVAAASEADSAAAAAAAAAFVVAVGAKPSVGAALVEPANAALNAAVEAPLP